MVSEPAKRAQTRVLLYCRQSLTDAEDGDRSLSLDSQARLLADRAAAEGWRVAGEVRDADTRGYLDETERPALAEALSRAEAREYDTLIVYDLSRLARSLRLQEVLLHRLAAAGVGIVSHTEPWVSTSPLVRQLMGAVNEERTRELSRHVKRATAEKRRRGLHWGSHTPYGYQPPASPKEPMTPHPEHARHTRDIFARFAEGFGHAEIGRALERDGVLTPRGHRVWRLRTIDHILRNPVYAGFVELDGELIEGQHEPLIDGATWEAVQARLGARQRPVRRKNASSWLEGLIVHEAPCGARLSLYGMDYASPAWRPRFVCWRVSDLRTGAGCGVRPVGMVAQAAEVAVRRLLVADLAGRLPLARVLDDARRHHAATNPLVERRRRDLIARRRQVEARRNRIEDLYLSGQRDRAWFDAEDARVNADLTAIASDVASLPEAPSEDRFAAIEVWLSDTAFALADPALPTSALAAFLRGAGVALLGPAGIGIRYRPEVAQFLGKAESGRIGGGQRERLYARAVELRARHTWAEVWDLVTEEFPDERVATVEALKSGIYHRRRREARD